MTTVRNTIAGAGAGRHIRAFPSTAWITGGQTVATLYTTATAADGSWSLDLPPNPDGTFFTVYEDADRWQVIVPASGPVNLPDIITTTVPPPAGPVLALTRGQADGLYLPIAGAGQPNGTATLDGSGLVPVGQLPPSSGGSIPSDGAANVASLRTLGTGALQATAGNDARLADSRTPTGAAGGALSGTYPNPGIGAGVVTPTQLDRAYDTAGAASTAVSGHEAALDPHPGYLTPAEGDARYDATGAAAAAVAGIPADATAGTASLRTLGVGAQQAAAGNHTHAGGGYSKAVKARYITTGDTTPPTDSSWAPLAGFELAIPAAVGDWLSVDVLGMWSPSSTSYFDLAVIVGSTLVRLASSGDNVGAVEGPTWWYPQTSYRTADAAWGFQVVSGDLDGGNVRVVVAHKGNGAGVLFASPQYPFYWRVTRESGVTVL